MNRRRFLKGSATFGLAMATVGVGLFNIAAARAKATGYYVTIYNFGMDQVGSTRRFNGYDSAYMWALSRVWDEGSSSRKPSPEAAGKWPSKLMINETVAHATVVYEGPVVKPFRRFSGREQWVA